ncbi:hypothetical protein KCM76_22305 [Zooshikella marina]|uniref:hypothetical protein n=1 Tax=Zooshikella ganghwensis TaxID=202772 RepID=UPI001BAEDCB0|nr:hypothetical protein [Zooshikella ganghwensis]MBU2708742.1 hypothetical protein [Zooshikella ganghwensis]
MSISVQELQVGKPIDNLLIIQKKLGYNRKDFLPIFRDQGSITKIFKGERGLSMEHIVRLRHQFDIPYEYWIDEEKVLGRKEKPS